MNIGIEHLSKNTDGDQKGLKEIVVKIKAMNILHFILMKNSMLKLKTSNDELSSPWVNLETSHNQWESKVDCWTCMDICQVYLLVSVVVRIDVVVKFLVFVVLLVT